MPNIFWFIILGFIGVISSVYTIYKKRDKFKISTLIVFYMAVAGLTWICEFLVLGLFNSYIYRTGIFKDVWEQNLLGHLILNTSLYPATALIMVAFSLKYKWISFVAIIFTLIDYLYVKLNIYEHHWWKFYMTAITVVIVMLLENYWFKKIQENRSKIIRAITFYFVAILIIHAPAPILMLLNKQYYKLYFINNLFKDPYLSSIIIIFLYQSIEALIAVICTCVLKKWYWALIPFFISIISQSIFYKTNIMVINSNWNFIYTLLIYDIFIAIFIFVEKNTLKSDSLFGYL